MEHKKYQKPTITVIRLQHTHIICTSDAEPGGGNAREYRGDYWEENATP
jgi:hypothetical protein